MGFTAKWLTPPILLFIVGMFYAYGHQREKLAGLPMLVALIWFGMGMRACRLYWRSRFRARGARDGWSRR
jgi:1,4-dihydroxy-2-naphthoate octaprenyltransferase